MNKLYIPILLLLTLAQSVSAQWSWMEGERSANITGEYGILFIPAQNNQPGSRIGASTWTDSDGNLWLFGGQGYGLSESTGLLNDIWRYNTNTGMWTWMGGTRATNNSGNYGIQGLPLLTNQPGARRNATAWVDNDGNFWLFGGVGYARDDDEQGYLNDLWVYSPATAQWTWIAGSDDVDEDGRYGNGGPTGDDDGGGGGPGGGNRYPGGRAMAAGWVDRAGDLWLFGGRGLPSNNDVTDLNDVWKFTLSDRQWTWVKGNRNNIPDVRRGERGEFRDNNTPGGRRGSTAWVDKSGEFWLFGGGNGGRFYSDLWKFDRVSGDWAWIAGPENPNLQPQTAGAGIPDEANHPGARVLGTGITGSEGDLWFFGGFAGGAGNGNPRNSLWRYSIVNNTWTFLSGAVTGVPEAVFGTKGEATAGNTPGALGGSVSWSDAQGNLWVFGGESAAGHHNQLWKYFSACPAALIGSIKPATATICEGASQVLTASGGNSYQWRRNNENIAGATSSTYEAKLPGTYTVIVTKGQCSAPATNEAVITQIKKPTGKISPASATICEGGSQILTATGGKTYEWKRNGVVIAGETKSTLRLNSAGTYTAVLIDGNCRGDASNSVVVTQVATPAGTITPTDLVICEGGSGLLTASGGTSYQWMRDSVNIQGATSSTLTVTDPGTYSVIINTNTCSGISSNSAVVTLASEGGTRYSDVIAAPNSQVQLSAREIGTSYIWTPPTGLDNPQSRTPKAIVTNNTEYQVNIVTDQGCEVTDTVLVKIGNPPAPSAKVFVPTAFTPNGNNANDVLRPLGSIATLEFFKVYNRWGNLVFQTTQIGEGWNGLYKGAPQPSDTYTWMLIGTTHDGQPVKLSGKTLLIR